MQIVNSNNDYVDMISSIIAPENQVSAPGYVRSSSMEGSLENANMLKIGSLQGFVESEGPIENFSSDLFTDDEIHKIAILDLRMLNLDRNECNILVQSSGVFVDQASDLNDSSFSSDGRNSDNMESGLILGSGHDVPASDSRK